MSNDNQGTPAPKAGDNGDTTPIANEVDTSVNTDKFIPKSRFDEVNSKYKSAEERAELYKSRYEESQANTEEEKAKRIETENQAVEIEKRAWKSDALRSINPQVANILETSGATFEGNTSEDYNNWAKQKETELSPMLKESKANVDGNRPIDGSVKITDEQLAKMSPEERIEYRNKTMPRFEH